MNGPDGHPTIAEAERELDLKPVVVQTIEEKRAFCSTINRYCQDCQIDCDSKEVK